MPNAPASYSDITAIPSPRLAVLAANGSIPDGSDEQPYWHCLEITKGAGVVPTCELRRDLGNAGTRLANIMLDGQANWIVQVWGLDSRGRRAICLFIGEVLETQFAISKDGEYETATATIPHYRFGSMCTGQEVYNPQISERMIVDHPLEFNPEVDGVCVNNMKLEPRSDYNIWIDPESARTEDARNYHSATVEEWTLREIVNTLCRSLNDESFLLNPALADDWGEDAPAIRNVVLLQGRYLIDYLTQLLPAFGYDWYIEPTVDDDTGDARPQIVLFARGQANNDATDLYLDPIGQQIVVSQLESAAFNYNIGNVKNRITLQGSLKEVEVTTELYRAWSEDDDAGIDEIEEQPLSPIGRKWVANEGGDYTGLREEIEAVPDFGEDFVPKRRKAEDLLRWKDDDTQTARHYPVLQWSLDDGETWENVEKDWHRLADECGVWFSKPPAELDPDADPKPRLRLTCTLISDKRVEVVYTDTASINGETVEALIDARERFHSRRVETSGEFQSVLSGGADEVDDSGGPMQDYLDPLGDIQRIASVGISPMLHGIHLDRRIGQLIRSIVGRNIIFNAIPFGVTQRYPQVTGIRWSFAKDDIRTYLTVTPYASQNPDQRVRRRPKAS